MGRLFKMPKLKQDPAQELSCDLAKVCTETKSPGAVVRTFATGATRDTEDGKLDYEGFLSPLVLKRYAEYMNVNRHQKDGSLRDSDNWQKGIPFTAYMKSMFRHFMEVWTTHRAGIVPLTPHGRDMFETALCALLFNVMGYLHELLRERDEKARVQAQALQTMANCSAGSSLRGLGGAEIFSSGQLTRLGTQGL